MNKDQFEAITGQWPHMHFTAITQEKYGPCYELYAVDYRFPSKSCLFICRVAGKKEAEKLALELRQWLTEIQIKRDRLRWNGAKPPRENTPPGKYLPSKAPRTGSQNIRLWKENR